MQRTRIIGWIALGMVGIVLAVYLAGSILIPPAQEHPFFIGIRVRPLVIAHRGGKGLWPENTMYAFEQASRMGVDILEMDIHASADDVLVVIHDATVERTTDGEGPVSGFTLDKLKMLDAGYSWSSDGGQTTPYRGQGVVIPTVEEIFQAFPHERLNIEIKPAGAETAEALCSLILEYGMESQVLVASFSSEVLEIFRETCPTVATSHSEDEVRFFYILGLFRLVSFYKPVGMVIQVPEYFGERQVINRYFVSSAHKRNIQVHAWTINDTYTVQRLLALGVDGFISDYPDLLMELLAR